MPWGRIDDDAWRHPRFDSVSPEAYGLVWAAVSYANEKLLDGRLSHEHVVRLTGYRRIPMAAVQELVAAGLWEVDGDGFRIHDFHQYNPSREKVLRLRADDAARKAGGRRSEETTRDDSPPPGHPNGIPGRTPEEPPGGAPAHVPSPGSRYPGNPGTLDPSISAPKTERLNAEHSAMWEAFVGEKLPTPETTSEARKWHAAIEELRGAGKGASDVGELVRRYRERFPLVACTPRAIAANLGEIGRARPKVTGRAVDNGGVPFDPTEALALMDAKHREREGRNESKAH